MNPIFRITIVALSIALAPRLAIAEAPIISHGSFVSPNGRYSLEFEGFIDREFQYAMKDRKTKAVQQLAGNGDELWGPLYNVQWTGDSQSVLLVYHIADGSVATVLHFGGTTWRVIDISPTPVDEKTTAETGYFETVFDHKVGLHQVWISYGVQTDTSRRNSQFFVCNFNYDPTTQSINNIMLRHVDIPTFVRLKMKHDYSESPWPRSS